jgi:hypothetical protein
VSDKYHLDKYVWRDQDFDQMGWHDATIHAIAFGPAEFELSLALDYIFEWRRPLAGDESFQFWVSPCTLVFENIYEVHLEAESYSSPLLSVTDLQRSDPRTPRNAASIGKDREWLWTFECTHGELSFRAAGFSQYVRCTPLLRSSQALSLSERGGYSFDRSNDERC